MLTTEDRRWLTGEKTYEGEHAKQQRYQRRRDIRERVYNSILDFSILLDHLEASERAKLFDSIETDPAATDDFTRGLRDAITFILYNTGITEVLLREDGETQTPLAEWLLQEALYLAGKRDGILVEDVDFEITATQLPLPSVLADLEAGNDVSPAGLRLLLESDKVDTVAVQECIREMIFDAE